ncbi:hypothetical protein LOTGIDRAFT_164635 [Lottia gigantea]|uniref:Uncharacterized protein n=1 Tax=Lottia gigantea TaxID=225164 RepID=V3ZZX6_LOTGI|nr:hypothetical protein LOTGIDRAFT_164635 [Lottia gigantea]ESO89937.1 hypothetical protein LOTGIDRAFT_164635 [Lottia gigantea]
MQDNRITLGIFLFGFGLLLNFYTVTCMTWNVARGKPAYPSSGINAINAVDGDPSTCFRTKDDGSDSEVTLTIDLKQIYKIYGIAITTSNLGLPGEFKNFQLQMLNLPGNSRPMCYRENTTVPDSTHVLYICDLDAIGNMLYINPMNSSNRGILTVCEVEVLARPVEFGLMCRESGFSFNETPTHETSLMLSAVGCAVMCKQIGCDAYISKNENAVNVCMLYSGRKFVLNGNVNSNFYLNC